LSIRYTAIRKVKIYPKDDQKRWLVCLSFVGVFLPLLVCLSFVGVFFYFCWFVCPLLNKPTKVKNTNKGQTNQQWSTKPTKDKQTNKDKKKTPTKDKQTNKGKKYQQRTNKPTKEKNTNKGTSVDTRY
jgi:hypothetical protein